MTTIVIEEDGRRQRLTLVRTARGVWVGWPGGAALIAGDAGRAKAHARPGDLVAPLTGKVVQLLVEVGDSVKAEQLVVVLEAMKMEYRLTAPTAGKVASVHCKVGDLVDQGTSLVELHT